MAIGDQQATTNCRQLAADGRMIAQIDRAENTGGATLTLARSIVAANMFGVSDCINETPVTFLGYNLDGDGQTSIP